MHHLRSGMIAFKTDFGIVITDLPPVAAYPNTMFAPIFDIQINPEYNIYNTYDEIKNMKGD